MSMRYEVGNLVKFYNGAIITATVVARVDRIWDGDPGFIGKDLDGVRTWGLDTEILAVGIISDDDPRGEEPQQ